MPMVSLRAERAKRRVIKARGICFKGTGGILTQARKSVLAWVVNANAERLAACKNCFGRVYMRQSYDEPDAQPLLVASLNPLNHS
jgi:hypothetical protein